MPVYIEGVVNLKDYKNLYDLTQQCNEVWETWVPDAGAMSATAAVHWSYSLACSNCRGSSPFCRMVSQNRAISAAAAVHRFHTRPAATDVAPLTLPVPEFIDRVFTKTSPKRSFSVMENERFGLVFAKTGSINSGTGEMDLPG
jgi:hypothetical protein